MNFGEWFGLILFLLAFVITGDVLGYDAWRKWVWHIPTISWLQWVALREWWYHGQPFPWLVMILPAGVGLQAVGLMIHFLSGLGRGGVGK